MSGLFFFLIYYLYLKVNVIWVIFIVLVFLFRINFMIGKLGYNIICFCIVIFSIFISIYNLVRNNFLNGEYRVVMLGKYNE